MDVKFQGDSLRARGQVPDFRPRGFFSSRSSDFQVVLFRRIKIPQFSEITRGIGKLSKTMGLLRQLGLKKTSGFRDVKSRNIMRLGQKSSKSMDSGKD
jgi:hypothetical protein